MDMNEALADLMGPSLDTRANSNNSNNHASSHLGGLSGAGAGAGGEGQLVPAAAVIDNEKLRHTFLVYYSRLRRAFNRWVGEG